MRSSAKRPKRTNCLAMSQLKVVLGRKSLRSVEKYW